jgi:hypothetical protein
MHSAEKAQLLILALYTIDIVSNYAGNLIS